MKILSKFVVGGFFWLTAGCTTGLETGSVTIIYFYFFFYSRLLSTTNFTLISVPFGSRHGTY
jgi:hypothetical protein